MIRIVCVIGIVVILCSVSGCAKKQEQSQNTLRSDVAVNVQPVEKLDEAGLKKLITERKGKLLFVNVWATWCAPCVEEFPDLVKLAQHYNGENVEVIAISADFPDEIDSKILPFLKKQQVPFKTYVGQFENQDSFINSLNIKWNGALPATFIYDAEGKQRFFTIGKSNFDRFKNEIEKVRGKT
ncbi:MAG: redoxin domain-containing protein [Ignavibacteriales bacterium]|nr:redoxin domain-containing protein [Ignavibacteriales bacterium]